ncbi:hypothetical protein Tco_1271489, partial [Tanacetum coccineum]
PRIKSTKYTIDKSFTLGSTEAVDNVNILFGEEVLIFCLRVRSLRCLFVKGAYGCILVDALLPGLTTRLTNEIHQNDTGGSGDQPPTIHTWLERFGKQKPRSFSSATTPIDAKTGLLTLRRYSRFWDVLMNSRLGWQVTSLKEIVVYPIS